MAELLERVRELLADRYSVERPLGQGGMAVVFLASDLKHHREIALKVMLPETAAAIGPARFSREIEVAARLQHPNILPLLDSGHIEDLYYYAMPFVEGESLRDRLSREGPLPIHDVVRILTEVSDALSHAHEHGVVHRDIKPENVLLSGRHALVADFGVAKAASPAAPRQRLTRTGTALGTPAYMAPEQASGDPHQDHRVDIYSLGVMGFELLTGRVPFAAPNVMAMLEAHLSEVPEAVEKLRPAVPPALGQLVMRCLAKAPADRWQTAAEIVAALEPLATPSGEVASAPTVPLAALRPRRQRWTLVVSAAAGLAGVVMVALALSGRLRQPPFPIVATGLTQVTSDAGVEFQPAISPDGKQVAYVAGAIASPHLAIRSTVAAEAGGELVLEGSEPGSAWRPSWSADGEFVRFVACPRSVPIRLGSAGGFGFKGCHAEEVPRLGGAGRPVAMPAATGWAVSPDGARVAWVAGDTLYTALSSGGGSRPLLAAPGTGAFEFHSMRWSPDGRRLAYVRGNASWLTSANVDLSSIWVADPDRGTAVLASDSVHLNVSPDWLDSRHLLYVSDRDGPRGVYLVEIGHDGARGAPRLVPGLPDPHSISYSSASGRLAIARFTTRQNIWSYPLDAAEPVSIHNGTPLTGGPHVIEEHDVSPDGQWIVFAGSYFAGNFSGNLDLYRMPTAGGEPVALTSTPVAEEGPAVSPDGREIAFFTMEPGNTGRIWVMPATGGAAVCVSGALNRTSLPRWRPDGLALSFSNRVGDEFRVWIATRDSVGAPWRAPVQLLRFAANAMDWAPDGRSVVSSAPFGVVTDLATRPRLVADTWQAARRLRLERSSPVRYGRDGRTVYVVATHEDGRRGIWAVPVAADTPRLVVAFDDPAIVPLTGSGSLISVGRDRLYLTTAQYESDIWVATLKH